MIAVTLGALWSVAAAAPMELAHSARLLDAAGNAVNGATTVTVRLYDESENELWRKAYPGHPVADGYFSVTLAGTGEVGGALDTSMLDHSQVWVGIQVGSNPEMTPRMRLLSVPYSGQTASVPVDDTPGACTGTGSIRWNDEDRRLQVCHEGVWLGMAPTGIASDGTARRWADGSVAASCEAYRNSVGGDYAGDIGDGLYHIDPDGDGTSATAWCDMTTDGGGWTMCYTEQDGSVNFETETSSSVAFGTDGYRADCRALPFSEVLYQTHVSGRRAWFSKNSPGDVRIDEYNNAGAPWGTWTGGGEAITGHLYEVMACNTPMFVGLMTSGHTTSCYKTCNSWCSDTSTHYYRVYGSSTYQGVVFARNGHNTTSVGPQRMSVGIR